MINGFLLSNKLINNKIQTFKLLLFNKIYNSKFFLINKSNRNFIIKLSMMKLSNKINEVQIISTENLEEFSKQKFQSKVIGTHSGAFHADEILACVMLKYTEEFKDANVVRSRNPDIWKLADILCDVGGEFNAEKKLFDHHQKEFTGKELINNNFFVTNTFLNKTYFFNKT